MKIFNSLYGAVMVRVYYKDSELEYNIERFEYVYSETEPDSCNITFNLLSSEVVDKPEFQEESELVVNWGYLEGKTKIRKVYVDNPKWSFSKSGRKLILECKDKSTTMKQTRSKKIHENVSLPDLAKTYAEKHATNAYMEQVDEVSGETNLIDLRDGDWKSKSNEEFKTYEYYPQSNKTDFHVLEEEGRKETNGEWVPVTRDDSIILRKRNFAKKPLRSYILAQEDGELLSFDPETKNTNKLGSAVASIFSAWDAQQKTYLQGIKDMINNNSYMLAEYIKKSGFLPNYSPADAGLINQYPNYKLKKKKGEEAIENQSNDLLMSKKKLEEAKKKGDGKAVAEEEAYLKKIAFERPRTRSTFGRRDQFGNAVDNTAVTINYMEGVTGEELLEANEKAQLGVLNVNHDETADNLKDAGGPATNNMGRSNLKRNPASALLWGNTDIEDGQILGFYGVGKKYSGNYYCSRSVHTIEDASGYTTSVEISREGHNIKANSNEKAIKESKKLINKEIGIDKDTLRKVRVKVKQNQRK